MFYQVRKSYSNRLLLIKQVALLISKISLFLLLLIALILFLVNRFNPTSLENFRTDISKVANPVTMYFDSFAEKISLVFEQIDNVINANTYSKQLRETKNQNFRLKLQYNLLAEENEKLRKMLNFIPNYKKQVFTAKIISKAPGPFVKSAYIKSEEVSDLEKDNIVLNDDGLVGQIESVSGDIANIILITDRRSNVPVKSKNSGKRAILEGNGTNITELGYLVSTKNLTIGEEILTSGDGGIFPADIPVGYIEKIENDRVYVATYADMESLDYVFILK
ncbi:MAG: rod shape-determining protein MreC [Rickettsiales bacterium]|nr:rod shape-determining protein MreC [Rickettsiales bacterium]